ncbi:flavin reductase family protein [Paenarthrobacter sp. Z7-10]|uniref:flavin reductase family protein n=1 Tax=Paenarthrobacter sp. Z7-10 TaxID=2787635 RepID=UPI0022A93B36|nr:flavin reductase family protein [Paenarthrobacter sp. Z7-10]MCZ2402310.1 flavin reductase family protein [Paenarthrobacter sp. Z7-10]
MKTLDASTLQREVLGRFASGIAVVTAIGRSGPIGFTCQSFASLSLNPPLVSFSPSRSSSTWPRIREAESFCINVLSHEHESISNAFARSGSDKFANVGWTPAPSGAPILDGVIAWADCTLWAEYDGGDHTIVSARVHSLAEGGDSPPLLFYRGGYGL